MHVKWAVIGVLMLGVFQHGNGQTRPRVQDTSLWVQSFMADGRLDEWGDTLRAFDAKTSIEYSIGNDGIYLYLAVRSNRTTKLFMGGVGLEIERADLSPVEAIFPHNPIRDFGSREARRGEVSFSGIPRSLEECEQIEISGIGGLGDTIVYIANEFGIQAAGRQVTIPTDMYPEGELFHVVELAIPLKHLLPTDSGGSDVPAVLDYRIRFRGVVQPQGMGTVIMYGGASGIFFDVRNRSRRQMQYEQIKSQDLYEPTELSGTYRLAVPHRVTEDEK